MAEEAKASNSQFIIETRRTRDGRSPANPLRLVLSHGGPDEDPGGGDRQELPGCT